MFSNVLKKNIHYLSPTVSINNQRDFEEDSLLNVQAQQPYLINSDTLMLIKSTSFYRLKAKRVMSLVFELPYVLYYPKSGLGLDLGAGIKYAGSLDNIYARIGFYIPIIVDNENTVTIEPIIRINKLNKSSLSFLKDRLNFGFNISVSIPKFLSQ